MAPVRKESPEDLHALGQVLQEKRAEVVDEMTRVVSGVQIGIEQAKTRGKQLIDAAPSRGTLRRVVGNTEIPNLIVKSPRLLGLLVPPPAWPAEKVTIGSTRSLAAGSAAIGGVAFVIGGSGLLVLATALTIAAMLPLLLLLSPLIAALAGLHSMRPPPPAVEPTTPTRAVRDQAAETKVAEEVLASVRPAVSTKFNSHISEVNALAVYGCGILAAAHVGGLRALELHGLEYSKLKTLAGVSAGSVVVAMLAVGYDAEGLYKLVESMPFVTVAGFQSAGPSPRECAQSASLPPTSAVTVPQ